MGLPYKGVLKHLHVQHVPYHMGGSLSWDWLHVSIR